MIVTAQHPTIRPVRVLNRTQFGRILETVRLRAGLRQSELAERVDTCRSSVAGRESGARNIYLLDAIRTLEECGYALVVVPLKPAPDGGDS